MLAERAAWDDSQAAPSILGVYGDHHAHPDEHEAWFLQAV